MQIHHPHQWEICAASGSDEPGRLAFADRYYHRLEVRWRPVKYVPNLDLILTRHRRKDKDADVEELSDIPDQWRGVARKTPEGTIVHAGRFFRKLRWLTEVTLVWYEQRDRELEKAILNSVEPQDPAAPVRLWEGMGLCVTTPRDFELSRNVSKVGYIQWDFTAKSKSAPELRVERIAFPDVWLTQPLRDWMLDQLVEDHRTIREGFRLYNTHRAEELISEGKVGRVAALRGIRKVRFDLSWICPVENRLYRISVSERTRDNEVLIPEGLAVTCCRPVPSPRAQ